MKTSVKYQRGDCVFLRNPPLSASFSFQKAVFAGYVEAGAGFGHDAGHVAMASDQGFREDFLELHQQEEQLLALFAGAGVGRTA